MCGKTIRVHGLHGSFAVNAAALRLVSVMIAHQLDDQRRGDRHEKLSSVARLHRLACTASGLNGEHLALVCPGERLCDLSAGGPANNEASRGQGPY